MSRLYVLVLFAAVLGLPIAVSGCIGEVQAVYVPQSAVPAGWDHSVVNETKEVAKGAVEIKINQYRRQGDLVGDVYLVGVTDVPGVDEHEEIRKQIEKFSDREQVTLTETRTFELTLEKGQKVQATEYEIEKQVHTSKVRGNAWLLSWDAGDFKAGAVGWATTERPTLLGTEVDETAWEETQAMLRAASW